MSFTYKVKKGINDVLKQLHKTLSRFLLLPKNEVMKIPFYKLDRFSLSVAFSTSSIFLQDVSYRVSSSQLAEGLKGDCHSLLRFCGGLFRQMLNIYRDGSPLQVGVLGYNLAYLYLGGLVKELKYTRVFSLFHLSSLSFLSHLLGYDTLVSYCFSTATKLNKTLNRTLQSFLSKVEQRSLYGNRYILIT